MENTDQIKTLFDNAVASCNYEELQTLKYNLEVATRGLNIWKKDYEDLKEENTRLRQLLGKCSDYFEYLHDNNIPWDKERDGEDLRLLTRINEVQND